jgi:polysaccharide pyruvyl transferase WcaK-like protein
MYGIEKTNSNHYSRYLKTLVAFAEWLLEHGYDIHLFIGDLADLPAVREFTRLLRVRSLMNHEERIIEEPIASFEDVLAQLSKTDFVVATRFHNVLLALFLSKPSIAISFHHKCSSLMSQMELSEYCLDIKELNTDDLIRKFGDLERNADTLRAAICERAENFRKALNEQYELLFKPVAVRSSSSYSAAGNQHSEHHSVEES